MNIHKRLRYGTIGLLLAVSVTLYGQGAYDAIHLLENESGFGTRPLAMGGAYAALGGDYSSIYWNPAGLGTVKENTFQIGLSHLKFMNEASYRGSLTTNDQTFTRLNSLGVTIPLPTSRGSFVLAFGYNRILDNDDVLLFDGYSSLSNDLGFEIEDEDEGIIEFFPFDRDVQRYGHVSTEGGLHQWSLGGAVMLASNFTLGLTVSYLTGSEEYRYLFSQIDSDNIYRDYPGDFDEYNVFQVLQTEIAALSLKFGGILELNEVLKVGAVITSPSSFSVDEVHSMSDELYFDDGYLDSTSSSGHWSYDVTTPFYFDFGLAYSSLKIILSASGRYRDWSQTRFQVNNSELGEQDYQDLLYENDQIAFNYRPTIEYRFGAEFKLDQINSRIRGGYSIIPSPLKDGDVAWDKEQLSGGLNFKIDRNINIDFTYIYKTWDRDSWDGYAPDGVKEMINTNQVIMGLNYEF
jgi:long-subunit fatty acid transport protein